ncbi:MAG TPA: thiamine pyrophosphate-binding protein, partial [Polyangiaceae bacterium]|nr:thiamine pyrophosphate-binding protein [Polyangiaceae bacterium]
PAVPLLEAISGRSRLRIVVSKDESGAAHAADGYAWATGKPGVVVTIGGPGATNALTGLACSAAQGHPVLLISGEVNSGALGRRATQDGSDLALDVLAMSRPVTAMSVAVASPAKALTAFKEALRRAIHGRRPVHLSLPLDVQTAELASPEALDPTDYTASVPEVCDRAALARAAALLRSEARRALLLGSGARGSTAEVVALAETLGCPVATTSGGKGTFPEDHPLSVGVFSLGAGPLARAVLCGSLDVLCAVGTGLGEFATANYASAFAPRRALIHVDRDPAVFGRNYTCLGVTGDARTVIGELARALSDAQRPGPDWFDSLRQRYPLVEDSEAAQSRQVPLRPERVVSEVAKALPEDACVVADIGTSCLFVAQYLKIRPPQRCYIPMAWSCMGHPLAASIGVRFGLKRPTLCVTGDAAFLSKGLELHAAVENGVSRLVWVVLSNRGHALVRTGTKLLLGEGHAVEAGDFKELVDVAGIARSTGAGARVVEFPDELAPALVEAFAAGRPWVIDVRVEPDAVPIMTDRIQGLKGTGTSESS